MEESSFEKVIREKRRLMEERNETLAEYIDRQSLILDKLERRERNDAIARMSLRSLGTIVLDYYSERKPEDSIFLDENHLEKYLEIFIKITHLKVVYAHILFERIDNDIKDVDGWIDPSIPISIGEQVSKVAEVLEKFGDLGRDELAKKVIECDSSFKVKCFRLVNIINEMIAEDLDESLSTLLTSDSNEE